MRNLAPALVLCVASLLAGCALSCTARRAEPAVAIETVTVGVAAAQPPLSIERTGTGEFPARIVVGTRELLLNGAGLCEWGFLAIDLYEAALYVERRVPSSAEALASDQLMVIHLDFARALSAQQLRDAYEASVRINTHAAFEDHAVSLAALKAAMRDVVAGDTYSFLAEPGVGVTVQRNDEWLVTIEDDEFRKLFVRLYLGEKPPTTALRDALLGIR